MNRISDISEHSINTLVFFLYGVAMISLGNSAVKTYNEKTIPVYFLEQYANNREYLSSNYTFGQIPEERFADPSIASEVFFFLDCMYAGFSVRHDNHTMAGSVNESGKIVGDISFFGGHALNRSPQEQLLAMTRQVTFDLGNKNLQKILPLKHTKLIDFSNCLFVSENLSNLGEFHSVKTLALPFRGINTAKLTVELPPTLENLIIYNTKLNTDFLKEVDSIVSLKRLVLWNCVFDSNPENDSLTKNIVKRLQVLEVYNGMMEYFPWENTHAPHLKKLVWRSTNLVEIQWPKGGALNLQEVHFRKEDRQMTIPPGKFSDDQAEQIFAKHKAALIKPFLEMKSADEDMTNANLEAHVYFYDSHLPNY